MILDSRRAAAILVSVLFVASTGCSTEDAGSVAPIGSFYRWTVPTGSAPIRLDLSLSGGSYVQYFGFKEAQYAIYSPTTHDTAFSGTSPLSAMGSAVRTARRRLKPLSTSSSTFEHNGVPRPGTYWAIIVEHFDCVGKYGGPGCDKAIFIRQESVTDADAKSTLEYLGKELDLLASYATEVRKDWGVFVEAGSTPGDAALADRGLEASVPRDTGP